MSGYIINLEIQSWSVGLPCVVTMGVGVVMAAVVVDGPAKMHEENPGIYYHECFQRTEYFLSMQ